MRIVAAALSSVLFLFPSIFLYAQTISSQISPPSFSSAPQLTHRMSVPPAPAQEQMPTPPPMRYMPGMEEPLVATGPVTEQEKKDLDAALAAFHDAPAAAGANGDFDDYAKPLLAFMDAHPASNWNTALLTNVGFGYYHAGAH